MKCHKSENLKSISRALKFKHHALEKGKIKGKKNPHGVVLTLSVCEPFRGSPCLKARTLTVCVVDSGAMPSLLMVSLKVYSTPASSSEPEIPNTGPLEPRPKFRVEQCSGPWQREAGHRFSVKSLTCYFHENMMRRKLKDRKSCCDLKAQCVWLSAIYCSGKKAHCKDVNTFYRF